MNKFSRRGSHILIWLAALLAIAAMPVSAQPGLAVESNDGIDDLDGLAHLFEDANLIAPEVLNADGPIMRIIPDGAISSADNAPLSDADRELGQAAKRLLMLYRALGGQPGAHALLLQRTRNGVFAAREGSAGALSKTVGGAMGSALLSMARADASLPPSVARWIPQLVTAFQIPGMRPPPYPVARIPRNQRAVINLSGPEIARAGADAILAGPPGSTINILSTKGDRLQASTVFSQNTPDGFAKLYLYRASDALTPIASFDVSVGAGRAGATQGEPDDHGATARTATVLLAAGATHAARVGQIGTGSDIDMFTLRVTSPGMLMVTSRGSSDVTARLLDSHGNRVAGNDDGGAGYNFGLNTPVKQGNYLLSVQHCCGGNGNYQIDTTLTPQ